MSRQYDTVAVTFDSPAGYFGSSPSSRRYHYKAKVGLLQVGDKAVVDSPSSGETVVTVRAVNPDNMWTGLTKWVICKVDRQQYEDRKALAQAVDELQAFITDTVEELWALRRVEIMAREYPQIAQAVERLGRYETQLASLGGR